MAREFTFDTSLKKALVWATLRYSFPLMTALTLLITVLGISEPERFSTGPLIALSIFCGGIMFTNVLVNYNRSKKVRVLVSETDLSYTSGWIDVKIQFENITKVHRDKNGMLIIYTRTSPARPAAVITAFIKDLNQIETILGGYIQIEPLRIVPFTLKPWMTFAFPFAFFFFLPLNLFSSLPLIMVLALVGFLFPLGLLVYNYILFRKEYDSLSVLFLYLFLFGMMLFFTIASSID